MRKTRPRKRVSLQVSRSARGLRCSCSGGGSGRTRSRSSRPGSSWPLPGGDLRAADREGRRRAGSQRPELEPARRLRFAPPGRPRTTGWASTSSAATCSPASSTARASRSRSRSSSTASSCWSAWCRARSRASTAGCIDSLLPRDRRRAGVPDPAAGDRPRRRRARDGCLGGAIQPGLTGRGRR